MNCFDMLMTSPLWAWTWDLSWSLCTPGPDSIYPLHPHGSLGITDQTVYLPNGDTQFASHLPQQSTWISPWKMSSFLVSGLTKPVCMTLHVLTHMLSPVSLRVVSEAFWSLRLGQWCLPLMAILISLKVGLSKLVGKFNNFGFKIGFEEIAKIAKCHKEALPISYWWQRLGCSCPSCPNCPVHL